MYLYLWWRTHWLWLFNKVGIFRFFLGMSVPSSYILLFLFVLFKFLLHIPFLFFQYYFEVQLLIITLSIVGFILRLSNLLFISIIHRTIQHIWFGISLNVKCNNIWLLLLWLFHIGLHPVDLDRLVYLLGLKWLDVGFSVLMQSFFQLAVLVQMFGHVQNLFHQLEVLSCGLP